MAILPETTAIQYFQRQMRRVQLNPMQLIDDPMVTVWRPYGIRRHLGGVQMPSDPTMSKWAGTMAGQDIGAWGHALNSGGASQPINAASIVAWRSTELNPYGQGNEEV